MNRALEIIMLCALTLIAQGHCSAEKTRPQVGVYYFPGWYRAAGEQPGPATEYSEWRGAIMKAAVPRPVCGFYNDADPTLWDYYIPWMTTHGVDFIAFDWYYNAGQEYLNDSLDRGFLQSEKNTQVKFCAHWCNHGGGWWKKPLDQSKPAILAMTDLLCDKYFSKPNYLRINGRPVFMIYETSTLLGFSGVDGVRDSLAAMRLRAKEKGLPGLYLVAVYPSASTEYMKMLKDLGFDAFCAYTYCWMRPPSVTWDTRAVPYPDLAKMMADSVYPRLERRSREAGIPYWPTTFSGWDDRPRAGVEKAFLNLGSTPDAFGGMFRGALKHVNPASPVVLVEAWNEWGEGACIEPSKEHGFGYLRAIAAAMGKSSAFEGVPSSKEIASWNVLTPDELKAAKENESKPWPLPTPKRYEFGKSFDVPAVKMPYVFDLTDSGIPVEELALREVSVGKRTSEGTCFESTGGDPCIMLPETRIPMRQIKRIIVEGELTDIPASSVVRPEMEFYWRTGLMPEFAGFAAESVTWSTGGTTAISTKDIPQWKSTGTPFLRLRIDPCGTPGVKFRLRRVILSGD